MDWWRHYRRQQEWTRWRHYRRQQQWTGDVITAVTSLAQTAAKLFSGKNTTPFSGSLPKCRPHQKHRVVNFWNFKRLTHFDTFIGLKGNNHLCCPGHSLYTRFSVDIPQGQRYPGVFNRTNLIFDRRRRSDPVIDKVIQHWENVWRPYIIAKSYLG